MFLASPGLSPRQKAAVVVRMMLADGADMDLSSLPPELQALLAQEMAGMEVVDRDTGVRRRDVDRVRRVGGGEDVAVPVEIGTGGDRRGREEGDEDPGENRPGPPVLHRWLYIAHPDVPVGSIPRHHRRGCAQGRSRRATIREARAVRAIAVAPA